MQKFIKAIIQILIILLFFLLGYGIGEERTKIDIVQSQYSGENSVANNDAGNVPFFNFSNDNDLDLNLFWEVWNVINKEYLYKENIDPQNMEYGATYGLVQALDDPYSVFLEPVISEEFLGSMEGSFEGIGAALYVNEGLVTVEYTLKDSPAMKAGLKTGDIIYMVDDEIVTDLTLTEVVHLIRGDIGTDVKLTILREDETEPLEISVVRGNIDLESVTWKLLENNIAYIEINDFSEDTGAEFKDVVSQVLLENPTGIILDLRYNSGGYFDQALEVMEEFVKDGVVVKRSYKDTIDELSVHGAGRLADFDIIVLANGSTASASEIVAGALRDYGMATLVGETSYGKGTIQDLIQLDNGASLKITTAKWLTPNDTWVTEAPLVPDVEVSYTEEDYANETDPQLQKAVELLLQP